MYTHFVPPPSATELLTLWALMQSSCTSQVKAAQQQLQTPVPSQHILTQFMRYQHELLAKSKKVFNMHQQLLYVKASSLWHKHAVGYRMPVSLLLTDLDPGQCSPLGTTIVGKRHLFSISRATESHYIQNIWNSRKKTQKYLERK